MIMFQVEQVQPVSQSVSQPDIQSRWTNEQSGIQIDMYVSKDHVCMSFNKSILSHTGVKYSKTIANKKHGMQSDVN